MPRFPEPVSPHRGTPSPSNADTHDVSSTPKTTLFSVLRKGPLRVTVIGGGNWGTTVAKLAAENCRQSYIFDTEVRLWVHEKELIEAINVKHENYLYLPGITLPDNIKAMNNLIEAVEGASLLVFATPHQFLINVCKQLKGHINLEAKALSLIKGCLFEDGYPLLCSQLVKQLTGCDCCVMSGANVAQGIATQEFSETTVGYRDRLNATIWQQLFDRPYFRVNAVPDVHGIEISGAVKNVIALSAGFVDGLGYGTNTKAAVIRLGVEELRLFATMFFDGILEETFFDSAGYADVITTCLGGRNVRCAKEFVLQGGKSSWEDLETKLLKGQKLQGHISTKEVFQVIQQHQLEKVFPLFVGTYRIAFEGADPKTLLAPFENSVPPTVKTLGECNPCIVPPALAEARKSIKKGRN